jgi:peptide/nickel transport system ATP-binding protein
VISVEQSTEAPLLDLRDVTVKHRPSTGDVTIVSAVDFRVAPGETVGIVGESGSGKSILSKAIVGLLPPGVEVVEGSIAYKGVDLQALSSKDRAAYRGEQITLMFQDPFTMLNPLLRSGTHITEGLKLHRGRRLSRAEGRVEAINRLAEVGIDDPDVVDRYPFELSGGMRQRVALAAALARDPNLLIADEPSTALDVTTQAEILALLKRTQEARNMSLVLITHDLRVAFSVCDRVYVLYAGSVLEVGRAKELQIQPLHPYTHGLLLSEPTAQSRQAELKSIEGTVPRPDDVATQCTFAPRCAFVADTCRAGRPPLVERGAGHLTRCIRVDEVVDSLRSEHAAIRKAVPVDFDETKIADPIASIVDVVKTFRTGRGDGVKALRGVSMDIGRGSSVGLVGESGSGKTTLGRCVVGLDTPTSGEIRLIPDGATRDEGFYLPTNRASRKVVQIVFQDPYSSLDPRQKIGAALVEPILSDGFSRAAALRRSEELLDTVGLPTSYVKKHPASLSGGERQRVAIARALSLEPGLLVCDEPVSALDVSVQAQILKLFRELQERLNLSLLFITHDLAVVRQVVDSVHILYQGEVVESGPIDDVMDRPSHEYTQKLIASIPGEELPTSAMEPMREGD